MHTRHMLITVLHYYSCILVWHYGSALRSLRENNIERCFRHNYELHTHHPVILAMWAHQLPVMHQVKGDSNAQVGNDVETLRGVTRRTDPPDLNLSSVLLQDVCSCQLIVKPQIQKNHCGFCSGCGTV